MKIKHLIIGSACLCLAFSGSAVALAKADQAQGQGTSNSQSQSQKLTATKLQVCEREQTSIRKRNQQLDKMAQNMLTTFAQIASKVQTYYTDTVLPSGITVENYDQLATDITTKKAAVQTALSDAVDTANSFNCNGDDPKGQLNQYREQMQNAKTALKQYRTSIKNMIVAINTVMEEEGDTTSDTDETTGNTTGTTNE